MNTIPPPLPEKKSSEQNRTLLYVVLGIVIGVPIALVFVGCVFVACWFVFGSPLSSPTGGTVASAQTQPAPTTATSSKWVPHLPTIVTGYSVYKNGRLEMPHPSGGQDISHEAQSWHDTWAKSVQSTYSLPTPFQVRIDSASYQLQIGKFILVVHKIFMRVPF